MSTVVLDTNVLLALWIFSDPEVAALRAALESRELTPVRSAATDAELAEVLARPELFSVPSERQAELLKAWESLAPLIADILPADAHCRDALDQKFVDLALTAGSSWLITRDRDLLKLRRKLRKSGVAVVTPAEFARLRSQPNQG